MADEWISTTEAAARLTAAGDKIDRSSLSRYLKQHSEAVPTKRVGRQNLVDFPTLKAHRSENIRVLSPVAEPMAPVGSGTSSFKGSQADGAARKAQADAELREMDLAERRGELTIVAEVDRAGREAVVLMRTAFERAVETEAADLAVKYGWDERTARIALKAFSRTGLDVFHQEIMTRLDMIRRRKEGGEDRPAHGTTEATALQ
jgi:hypothetical protein